MKLINPIYNAAFKFLLEDAEIAKGLIGRIIGEEIVELRLRPQEPNDDFFDFGINVLKMDFRATIKTNDDDKRVIVEILKGKDEEDFFKLRDYLAIGKKQNLPIIRIYFLEFELVNVETPVMKSVWKYTDLTTGQVLTQKGDFMEELTHDGYFIQIARLQRDHRNELEGALKVFNQSYKWNDDGRLMVIVDNELNADSLLKKMGERLALAAGDEKLLNEMAVG